MPDEITEEPVAQETESPSEPSSYEEAANRALESIAEESPEEPGAGPETSEEVSEQVEDTPDYLKWASSVEGNTDPETGELKVDALARQAHNVHLQTQEQARKLSELQKILENPIVSQAVRTAFIDTGEVKPAQPAEPEKPVDLSNASDEEVLAHYVTEILEKSPLVKQMEEMKTEFGSVINVLQSKYVNGQIEGAIQRAHSDFGKEAYEGIKDQVGAMLQQTAQQAGVDVGRLVTQLALNDQLYDVIQSAASKILYPDLRKQVTASESKKQKDTEAINRAKRASGVPKKGSPVTSQPTISSFEDAVAAAKEQLSGSAS